MSGHSKWSTIKRRKGAVDAARGRLFTKLIKEITVAARDGGGNPDANPGLRLAVNSAKLNNMPAENIKRAIQRGTGELPGTVYEEVVYEGYGPAGVAVLVDAVTDNKNRTVSDIRRVFERYHGKLGEVGSVAWMFQKRGFLVLPREGIDEDRVLSLILEAGAEDMKSDRDSVEVTTPPESFEEVKRVLESSGVTVEHAELQMVPQASIRAEGKDAELVLRLMDALEEHDDVQHVYANFDIDEKVMAGLNA